MTLFAVTVFLSAFLLFQVQPVIGKYILPWFGSTPGVWTTCLLFFQTLLLAGYAYAHFSVSRLSRRGQAVTHLALLGLALILLPITPSDTWKPAAGVDPTWHILLLLLSTVGGPFLLLSATGPLLQAWFARVHPGRSPYRLYALSNLGSLLALVSYPLIVERFVRLAHQTIAWSLCWVVFAMATAVCAHYLRMSPDAGPTSDGGDNRGGSRPAWRTMALWVALAASGSGMLMASTNHLCQDVAVVPLLWVVPLGVYLLSFIICFDRDRWYLRPLFITLLLVALAGAAYGINGGVDLSLGLQIGLGAFALFICCMCCHGELARRKPHPRHLTLFYLAVSIGGAVGGFFVAIVCPAVFSEFLEYPLLLTVCFCLVSFSVIRDFLKSGEAASPSRWSRIGTVVAFTVCGLLVLVGTILYFSPGRWPWLKARDLDDLRLVALLRVSRYAFLAIPLLVVWCVNGPRFWRMEAFRRWRSPRFLAGPALLLIAATAVIPLVGFLAWSRIDTHRRIVDQERNFYGVLKIREYSVDTVWHDRTLIHGRINHGSQVLNEKYRAWPTCYYGPRSGVGLAIRFHPERGRRERPFRIGVVGLGTGTLAAYANASALPYGKVGPWITPARRQPADSVSFYEINPVVKRWSRRYFSYLADAEARGADIDVTLGDARIVMERQLARGEPQAFDVLAIDAFSGDAIPVHLLTNECMKIFLGHIREDGILAFHVTNRHLSLAPVVRRLAVEHGYTAVLVEKEKDVEHEINANDWMLVTRNLECIHRAGLEIPTPDAQATGPLWTDDFSSLLSILKED